MPDVLATANSLFDFPRESRPTAITDPLGNTATFKYDALGRLAASRDRLGRRRVYEYDALGRVTAETWIEDGAVVEILTATYDANGNQLTAQKGAGTYTMTYDALNRATVVKGLWGVTLTFLYDAVGNRTELQDSFGGVQTSVYDNANRLTQRKLDVGTPELRVDFTYNAVNQIETLTRWRDLTATNKVGSTTYSYDALNRVENLQHRGNTGTLLSNYTYTFDDGGRLTTEVLDGTTKTYTYDTTNQLEGDGVNTYTYDGTGNRANKSFESGEGNQLTTDGTWDYQYDKEGNLTKKLQDEGKGETWTYGYDHRNQMVWAEKRESDEGTLEMRADYQYDYWGNRVEKVADLNGAGAGGVQTTRYALDGWKVGRQKDFIGLEN